MPHWLIKSALQRAISLLPASHKWNALFQQHVTHSLDLSPARFEGRLNYCRMHLDHFLELHADRAEGFAVLELGTGWFPVVPLGLFLCGAGDLWTFDIAPLLSPARLKATLARFAEYERAGRLREFLPRLRTDRLAQLAQLEARTDREPPEALLEGLKIHVRVRDAQNTGLPSGAVELFASTGVLEYIPVPVLKAILAEFKRLGSASATQSHYLNLVDQYSYFDRSITPFNFLKFSPRQWEWYNSPLTWLNRLRISDYRALFSEGGFQVTKELSTSGAEADLRKIRLAPEFEKHTRADLLVLTSWVVARPAAAVEAVAR